MQRKSIEERFWAKVDKSGDCWIWHGGHAGNGYGVMSIGFKAEGTFRQTYAHRLSYEMAFGTIPNGLQVCHRCDNPPCVRPEHLFTGTRSDNMRDARIKGRGVWPVLAGEASPRHKLSAVQVTEIRALGQSTLGRGRLPGLRQRPMTQEALAERFGVSDSLIGAILRGEAWRNVM